MAAPLLEISARPNALNVTDVYEFVLKLATRSLEDADAADRLALAAHELLENAIRYTADGETRLRIDVEPQPERRRVEVHTWNKGAAHNVQRLARLIEEMNRQPDALQHYLKLMAAAARAAEGSGLGLARVRAEAGMAVSQAVTGDVVCITAHMDLPLRRR